MTVKPRFRGSATIRAALLALVSILLAAWTCSAQGPSPLVGKTIHVYNPSPGDTLNVDMSGIGYRMTPEPGTHFLAFTVPTTIQNHITRFGIRNNYGQNSFWISRTGVAAGGADAFTAEDFAGGNELWIIVDPGGPATALPAILTQAPKVVHVFNPWPVSAPVMVLSGGTRKGMLNVAGNCGWFWAFLLKPAENSFYLEEANRADTYGQGGLGTNAAYNMTAEFAAKGGTTLWLDTDSNAWLTSDPKKNRPCGYLMAATVRDFGSAHVDFDFDSVMGEQSLPGMVQTSLGADRKPVRTATASRYFNKFEEWFNTTPGANAETCVDIPMGKADNGMWQYDSYETPAHGFWPIDDFNTYDGAPNPYNQKTKQSCYVRPIDGMWTTSQPAHNMNFCLESHATFVYQKGQTFEFRGDDDVWAYINGKLVLDLGGIHTPKEDTIELDKLGLIAGQTYKWDFFYCDRQPCGSALGIKTSIYFKQQRALDAEADPDREGAFQIVKRAGRGGSCGSAGDSVQIVPVANLVYKLWDASGAEVQDLAEGSNLGGGIVIATPSVLVDTSKMRSLAPGGYRIVAYEPSNTQVRVEIPFHVQAVPSAVDRRRKPDIRAPQGRHHDALGRSGNPSKRGALRRFWRALNP